MTSELARLALHNLLRARARLAMTAGGVLVGTTAVIILIALTIGLQTAAEAGIGQSASLTEINVFPGFIFEGSGGGGSPETAPPQLTPANVARMWEIEGVQAVIPLVSLQSFVELKVGDYRGGAQILGVDPRMLAYLGVNAARGELSLEPGEVIIGPMIGRNFYDPSVEEYMPVVVDLFSEAFEMSVWNQMGNDTRDLEPRVAAELAEGTAYDYTILMRLDEVMALNEWVTGNPIDPETFKYDQVTVRATSRDTAISVAEAIKEMGFFASGAGAFLGEINNFFRMMRLVLGGVGGVALLVAAFGVANTMTMAILERTREIGLMKAVGATDRDVLTIFLIEAALVGVSGGAAGLGVSYLLQRAINQAAANAPAQGGGGGFFLGLDLSAVGGNLVIIPTELAFFALALATAVGVVAGFYPALRAARMEPVLALKTE